MMLPLTQALRPAALRRLTDERSYRRGEEYFKEGRVRSLAEYGDAVSALVEGQGGAEYRVRLSAGPRDERAQHSCTCPVGAAGAFCKHCVATALGFLAAERARAREADGPDGNDAPLGLDDVRAHLLTQDRGALVRLLMEQALLSEELRERLILQAARDFSRDGVRAPHLPTLRAAIDRSARVPGDDEDEGGARRLSYATVGAWARRMGEVVDTLASLLPGPPSWAPAVISLCEHALRALEQALDQVGDTDSRIADLLSRLQDLHYRACARARPEDLRPQELAGRLYAWEMASEHGVFQGAAATYADLIGPAGLLHYQRLAEAEWAGVKQLQPGEQDPERYGRRTRLTYIMETLAWQRGDLEGLVAIKSRDLSTARSFLAIAEIYRHMQRPDQALAWAERGVAAFPRRTDSRLRSFLAEEYHLRGRHEDAMRVIWDEFSEGPTWQRYQVLKGHAERAGSWPAWRERALGLMRKAPNADELVRALLWEGEVEAAWQAAQAGGCAPERWLELARRREAAHPQDALQVYQRQVERAAEQRSQAGYEEAVALLGRVREVLGRLGRGAEFPAYLEGVRAAHRPKRNLMKLVDQKFGQKYGQQQSAAP
jgi:uncharacterized Zn finger protein